ncbi:hypothetical protein ACFPOI_44000 [Nonomuraea angiospora]|uniref:FAD/NAD(P)-binding domain-containing protein n=1 Tax=Nonomuraea angiospora TaxID=46172 RepID=A0ABR9LNL2_9ACTN|nr:hypothetical protein [Nonomuraea angiospora]MBE1582244.1 hypothetical protein [Nonomuraea angiospora]
MAPRAQPCDELARAAGLGCDDGIVVDARSLASDNRTIAIGDCANLPDPSPWSGDASRLRLESVDNAVEQATSAAATLVGLDRPTGASPGSGPTKEGSSCRSPGWPARTTRPSCAPVGARGSTRRCAAELVGRSV